MSGLQREVGAHEPHSALDGGEGPGLDSLKVICSQAVWMLCPGGFLALETAGEEQSGLVKDMLSRMVSPEGGSGAFCRIAVVDDCFGVPRFVTAKRSKGTDSC